MSARVVVLDYGIGNVHSAVKALEYAGADVELTSDPSKVHSADGLVVPGVGAFAAVMKALTKVKAPELIDKRLAGGKPVLGICVGLQVMFEKGLENEVETEGLGQWPGVVARLNSPKLPITSNVVLGSPTSSSHSRSAVSNNSSSLLQTPPGKEI